MELNRDRFLAPTDGLKEEIRQSKDEDINTLDDFLNALDEAKTACSAWEMNTNKYYSLKRDINKFKDNISELIFTVENKLQELRS